jgi:hypothetical protein
MKNYGWRVCKKCGIKYWFKEVLPAHGFPMDETLCPDCQTYTGPLEGLMDLQRDEPYAQGEQMDLF